MRNNLMSSVKATLVVSAVFVCTNAHAWGQNGHRIIAKIAESHLSETTKTKLLPLLNNESLAQVSTWPDEMRSAPGEFWQRKSSRWHYINTSANKPISLNHSHTKNKESVTNILEGIHYSIKVLQDEQSSLDAKQFSLRFLVHLVGDSHQPFHAGRADDRGGNNIKVKHFGQETNLHSLWDSKLIEGENLSYTEFADFINTNNQTLISEYLTSTPTSWLVESNNLAESIYNKNETNISYSYIFDHMPIIKTRLQQGGIRLAGLLNSLFDESATPLVSALKMQTSEKTTN
ncbi:MULTISPECIES: S1/P1 nuclease [Pseudoalteromonas]|nr:S1/P1 nuclease [Pseudoalteromonas sp. NZS127]MBH0072030.1 S1/P1 nuclease [Pseudoalteromonas sp. NZS127]